MILTSAEANKRLKKLNDELRALEVMESKSAVFNAAVGEDEELIRPEYSFSDTQEQMEVIREKIIGLKHKINAFNLGMKVEGYDLTIDEVLTLLPMLSERRKMLAGMAARLPRERAKSYGYGTNAVIDYVIANYDVDEAEQAYNELSEKISSLQNAIDITNSTVKGIDYEE